MTKRTGRGICDKDPDAEEPDERESLTSGSGVAEGTAMSPPTMTVRPVHSKLYRKVQGMSGKGRRLLGLVTRETQNLDN